MNDIYIDLDNTLGVGIEEKGILSSEVRPDAPWFIGAISRYGNLWLLSWATREWADHALWTIGTPASLFKGLITREDLQAVERQMDVVESADVSDRDRAELYRQVKPIARPGVIFDDFPVGSRFFRIKTLAVGTFPKGPEGWIQVPSYGPGGADGDLRAAYGEFRRRNDIWRGRTPRRPAMQGA